MTAVHFFQYRPETPYADTAALFSFTWEGDKLRVQNHHVNCLFSNLTPAAFDKSYNRFLSHLHPDFSALTIDGIPHGLDTMEQEQFVQQFITGWIYYYTINNLPIQVRVSDFDHAYTMDYLLSINDRKYGVDTPESLRLGAKILRMDPDTYARRVEQRRWYYAR